MKAAEIAKAAGWDLSRKFFIEFRRKHPERFPSVFAVDRDHLGQNLDNGSFVEGVPLKVDAIGERVDLVTEGHETFPSLGESDTANVVPPADEKR